MAMKYTREQTKTHRQKWIDALRSGRYSQTHYHLRDDVSYSALGIACDISRLGFWDRKWGKYVYRIDNITSDFYLPIEVRDWLGLRSVMGRTNATMHDGQRETILLLNNRYKWSFDSIADIIEVEPSGLVETQIRRDTNSQSRRAVIFKLLTNSLDFSL